jgi:hypothetical protein
MNDAGGVAAGSRCVAAGDHRRMIVARTTPAGVAEIGAPFCDASGVV